MTWQQYVQNDLKNKLAREFNRRTLRSIGRSAEFHPFLKDLSASALNVAYDEALRMQRWDVADKALRLIRSREND